jgi:5'-3' exonuclease
VAGDPSDNLPGIRGAGLKTISKRFAFMKESEDYLIKDIVKECEQTDKPLVVHRRILDNIGLIEKNYSLMQLYSPSLSPTVKSKVNYALENAEMELNLTEFRKMMLEDGFAEWDNTELISCMRKIVANSSKDVT